MVESRSEFATALEAEIDASKGHWSELQAGNGGRGCAEANLQLFRSLQEQYGRFFRNWDDDRCALGEKIAEGAQGEIFLMRFLRPRVADNNDSAVLKVFKEGCSLEDLQQQWPPGMLLKTGITGYRSIYSGMMLKDGRFGFLMLRYWGDLRMVIDLRMQHYGNQAPPFSDETALKIMHAIASGMRGLHQDNIVHRDLKASNLLVLPSTWTVETRCWGIGEFDPTNDDGFMVSVGDYECSVGVVGTGFWRAPEILQGVKNCCVERSLFSKKSDVYSYAMVCYEVLTRKFPLEHMARSDYDGVLLQGARPKLPTGLEPWIQTLLERCWHDDLFKRPSFEEIVLEF